MSDNRDKEDKLIEYANEQGGYFTAKQAVKAGYSYRLHSYHVQTGRWIKIERGVFRLKSYPPSEREDFIRWTLWSRNQKDEPQIVASHETALAIHEISDVNPSKYHFIVPPGFRKKVPDSVILHRTVLKPEEVEKREGFFVTTPVRTLKDAAESHLSLDELRKAIQDALTRGLIMLKQIDVSHLSNHGKERMLMVFKMLDDHTR
ncbi:MAG: hypothetical protein A3G33_11245 [Omnitrophica bacterium RIFCSPLOWO2_12_FULL_44_17]|uniref:AbiEi antitoxin N-terminal domain-containing protein n=1 Tax=Candidatus Danuiimicrobium aquiferis TaxID=1801832 RepID=A0A1G1KRX8_9BACT|nr:MAG: hypothetical protein A3B72_09080 [Omnitrophica bacterium RIFCSPHIGHO2_02_FULL_45_28]OGW88350.1 MAG: hypothetical protein A3E74_10600 [Omnitrophica bacterium RIFCSPHIGHO2_12_FULL_44_12]OGW95572.1 MAG: hypothetical protein A3G33_11245 [Omnitrophica bacterium RIFCSPLOWO2_12_FULL_44_17]OGX03713.1 MAG: hypothetical protein A3J12_01245 [Omnitrophica bacterium RIFCSPLOWO2_02_FULL_44_11]